MTGPGTGEILHVEHGPKGPLLEGVLVHPHPDLPVGPRFRREAKCVLRLWPSPAQPGPGLFEKIQETGRTEVQGSIERYEQEIFGIEPSCLPKTKT